MMRLSQISPCDPDPFLVAGSHGDGPCARSPHDFREHLAGLGNAPLLEKQKPISRAGLEARIGARYILVFRKSLVRTARPFKSTRMEKVRFLIERLRLRLAYFRERRQRRVRVARAQLRASKPG